MRLLLIHAEDFSYSVKDKAIREPEPLERQGYEAKNALVVFTTVESGDNDSPEFLSSVADDIIDVARKVKAGSIVIYPYAHLSSDLAPPDKAISILGKLFEVVKERSGLSVEKAPFGWYKAFSIKCLGHPLSELSRTITPSSVRKQEQKVINDFYVVLTPDGGEYPAEKYQFKPGEEDLKILVEKEVFKRELGGGKAPRYLDYCKKFGFEWEPMSDVGHMRYGPMATLMMELVEDYAWRAANDLGFPAFKIRGTNMFRTDQRAIAEHAKLFGERMYMTEADEELLMRYAACFQQFAMIKDWVLSYRDVPVGMLEIADSYRYEQPGETVLCFRLRRFYMPDLHIFVRDLSQAMDVGLRLHGKIFEEINKIGRNYVSLYNVTKGFFDEHKDYLFTLSKREGKPILVRVLNESKYYWVLNVEYHIIDQLKRPREIATFQFDIGNAQRFGIKYVDEENQLKYPVIIHTAILGSVERFIFAMLDKAAIDEEEGKIPKLPTWLSPIQARVVPVSKDYLDGALSIANKLASMGIRVDVDDRDETLNKKIRDAETLWVPYIVIVGDKELKSGTLSVRARGRGQSSMSVEELGREIQEETRGYPTRPLTMPMLVSKKSFI
ncbi:hypothetical protein GCM10007981_02420 [Thermocladium modestius]|uniref:Threonine--tRNA ligase n=1 Tax=Thermocladium modestius TaxID=62609 RepID=A0A830GR77_9CREN|nr:threonine--tRNA ligase [Thermocladium modestius]GGP19298.1 hypothetical protein GCM10007981_02420 [Thermocladium modestius]